MCQRNAELARDHAAKYVGFLKKCRDFAIFKVLLATGIFLYSLVKYNTDFDAPDEVLCNARSARLHTQRRTERESVCVSE